MSLKNTARDGFFVLVACVITFGFWFGPDIARWIESSGHVAGAISEGSRVLDATDETGRKLKVHTDEGVASAKQPARSSARSVEWQKNNRQREKAREVLQRMAQTCAFWNARAGDESGRVFRDRACSEMRKYAYRTGQSAPVMQRSSSPTPAPSRSNSPPTGSVPVYTRECTRHERGSIAYRQCRAEEKQRLKQMCQYYRQKESWKEAAGWCAAADAYPIVK